MPNDSCTCCNTLAEQTPNGAQQHTDTENVIETAAPLDSSLPAELQAALGRFLGDDDDPVSTLGEWAAAVRRRTGGGAIAIDELCHTETETGHWGELDGDRYHFACFYDAVILAAIADQPVEIRTESPAGTVITAHADVGTGLTVSPPDAVFSFGIDETVVASIGEAPTLEDGYVAICPYVKAFPDPDSYERWAGTVTAATVAMPLAGATELAAALVTDLP